MKDKKQYTFDVMASPFSWMIYAQDLHEAANIIIKHSGMESNKFPNIKLKKKLKNPFYLNFGFAIENLLKGILIYENPDFISDYSINVEISQNHNLIQLSKKISKSMVFSKDETDLLKFLSEAIPYWGKYPIPKIHDKIVEEKAYNKETHDSLEKLYDKLILYLYEKIKDGNWTSPNGFKSGYFRDSSLEENFELSINELKTKINDGSITSGNLDYSKILK